MLEGIRRGSLLSGTAVFFEGEEVQMLFRMGRKSGSNSLYFFYDAQGGPSVARDHGVNYAQALQYVYTHIPRETSPPSLTPAETRW